MDKRNIMESVGRLLVDQDKARIIVPAKEPRSGFWFGGGNAVEDKKGNIYVSGRYRNSGDSRTGVGKGERGRELAVFMSSDKGERFEKVLSFEKRDLDVNGWKVLSIEGSALRIDGDRVELYVSTEKADRPFAAGLEEYHKPGTGSWTIERIVGTSVDELDPSGIATVLQCDDPRWFNIKDPFLYELSDGELMMGFCSHPFNWSSSNSGFAIIEAESSKAREVDFAFFPRGFCWDVGITRATCFLSLPRVGAFSDEVHTLCIYDGGEAMRDYPQHDKAKVRPRGYSCEELGGLAYFINEDPRSIERISITEPLFLSPHGQRTSRYVDVLETEEAYYTTWQQSQSDGSQPLVMNRVEKSEVVRLLGG